MTSERPVRIGIQLQPQHAPYALIRDRVREIEDLGADILFNWDHFFPLSGDPDGLHFEAWTELGSWAELTSRIEFGTLVNCNSYRNPDLQADMARTLDHISGGRFIFGTGSGWFERDYDEYGYEFGTAGQRLNALAEALPRIEARWAKLNPAPVRDIPVLIGGSGEQKTLRIVAQHADIWHSFVSPEMLDHKLDVLRGWCDEVGRDISEIEISNEQRAKDFVSADALRERGVTLFTVGISGPDYDLGIVKDWLAWRDAQNA
ncbi:LLM class F420-dependent oxidoreductase [Leifsonia sp. H3M29-4]|uniref:LLM class F420-dependent oxidoreductase n=1 Tax=Salinibacterium metalliresistens TaxID=3031321 RepID=UPI0023DC9903|nr:LLM class F420-dependent oxidoreductase [Salinibacterium metalliresistens]MDF1478709.1 LLM class F420-dependent oxidoreductase [Salinibacterium metalliresistens]